MGALEFIGLRADWEISSEKSTKSFRQYWRGIIILEGERGSWRSSSVHTGLPVRTRVRTELPAERHLPGRERGITASPALRVIGRSHRAGDATYNNGRRTAPSPSQNRAPGTVCPTRSDAAHLWLSSNALSKLTVIPSVLLTFFLLLLHRASWHCKFAKLGLPFPMLIYKYILFANKIYENNFVKQHSKTVMVWNYQNTDYNFKNKFIVLFIIIFGTISFPVG